VLFIFLGIFTIFSFAIGSAVLSDLTSLNIVIAGGVMFLLIIVSRMKYESQSRILCEEKKLLEIKRSAHLGKGFLNSMHNGDYEKAIKILSIMDTESRNYYGKVGLGIASTLSILNKFEDTYILKYNEDVSGFTCIKELIQKEEN
jgi:hypothetical protein